MPRHVRAVLAGIILIPLAWIGIALVQRLLHSKAFLPALAGWVVVFVSVLAYALVQVRESRRERVPDTPPRTPGTR